MALTADNISVVIPTYNRHEELRITLKALTSLKVQPGEIIVVDQSKNDESKKVAASFKSKRIKYVFSDVPAITRSRNIGVKSSGKKCKVICFIDDDVTVLEGYFEALLEIYNANPSCKGVAGFVPYEEGLKEDNLFERLARRAFFLGGRWEKTRSAILSAYGNMYPMWINDVCPAQWFPGDNMTYRREVFEKQWFDENLLGYTLAEDIDFGYRLSQRYPNSLFITPRAKIIHRFSLSTRRDHERMSYINQIDHFYFNFKNMNRTAWQKIVFLWSLMGISFIRVARLLMTRNREDVLKFKFFFISLWYCLTHLNAIRRGRVRDFKLSTQQ